MAADRCEGVVLALGEAVRDEGHVSGVVVFYYYYYHYCFLIGEILSPN